MAIVGYEETVTNVERLIEAVKTNGTWTAQRLDQNRIEVKSIDGHTIINMMMSASEFVRFVARVELPTNTPRADSDTDAMFDFLELASEYGHTALAALRHGLAECDRLRNALEHVEMALSDGHGWAISRARRIARHTLGRDGQ